MTNIERENKRLLDVVNEMDEKVSSASRTKVHQLGLPHREVHIWMFDKDKNIFFQKRGLHRPSAGSLDATVGGHVNRGETYMEAAVRETREETGLTITPGDLIQISKIKELSHRPEDSFGGPINNFIRTVYIYNKPVNKSFVQKEKGIPGGGFQKLSLQFLLELKKTDEETATMFDKSILNEELPMVLKHIQQ